MTNRVTDNQLASMAREQAALRRVATLVAQGAPSEVVFASVCEETGRLLPGATHVNLACYANGINETVAGWSERGNHVPTGSLWPLDGYTIDVLIQESAAPARVDSYEDAPGELAAFLRAVGVLSEVGAPVFLDGAVWGALIAGSDRVAGMHAGAEDQVASFAELITLAVANATARAELIASRARIVTAGDAARRRLARDLHDGAQQRLVTAILNVSLAEDSLDDDPEQARELLRHAAEHAQQGLDELRELAAGVHPSILTNRGLRAAAESLTRKTPLEVEVDVPGERFTPEREAAAYFLISEALTNAAKHARAFRATVRVRLADGSALIEIVDDGVGGADARGHGLQGMRDRAEALGGSFALVSPPGGGTRITATLPLSD